VSNDGHRHHERDDRAGVRLHQGQLTGATAGPRAGPAARYRLRPSVEVFPAEDGCLYFIRPGPGPDLVVARPGHADSALVARLAEGPAAFAELRRALAAAGADLSDAALTHKLDDLASAGLLLAESDSGPPLDPADAERFARQLPYFAEHGDAAAAQRRLMAARVVVLGCGGLGTWALGALASAGVRRFVLVDDDLVELSNLNRQILYGAADIGRPKVECAAEWLRRFEPRAELRLVRQRMRSAGDVRAVLDGADALVHAADWPPYEILRWADEACRSAGVPYITAGQVPPVLKIGPTYVPGRSACFACQELATREGYPLYEQLAAHRRDHETAATTLGPASGVVGTLLAMEVMHLLLGGARPATEGRCLLVDMRTLQTRWETIERRADCPACNHLVWHGGPRAAGAPHSLGEGDVASAASAAADGLRRSGGQPA
jgi:bacteriocin biosynthesis cyclodehydratase domain-containing protein